MSKQQRIERRKMKARARVRAFILRPENKARRKAAAALQYAIRVAVHGRV